MEETNNSVNMEVATPEVNTGMDDTDYTGGNAEDNLDNELENNVVDNVNGEVVNPDNEIIDGNQEKVVQTAEQNSMFAKIRRDAEARARDNLIAEMGMQWNDKPIKTYEDYKRAVREKQLAEEAQQRGLDPKFYTQFQMMQDELSAYKRNSMIAQQEAAFNADPVRGEIYNQWKDEIREMSDKHNVDLDTAFSLLVSERLPDILSMNQRKIQNETINKINANQISTPGSLGTANEQPSLDVWSMSDAEFEKMQARALSGGLRR